MEVKEFDNKILSATKWSSITEMVAKLAIPISNMILARILAPEAFGVLATITMIISFADMFTDAGFQKYLVQHEFKDEKEKHQSANVAFWTNFIISMFSWGVIALYSEQIAILVGNPGLGIVIIVSCIQLPLTSFSSIQMSLFKRSFDFKTLFFVRVISLVIPFVVTIPLALVGLNYWSLVIGAIIVQILNALVITIRSNWKPKFSYDLTLLNRMLSFSIWSMIEAISIWFTVWIDAFIIGFFLNEYFLGLYKTSTTIVNSLMAIITASITPVLFSALSRLQNDEKKFVHMFFKVQRLTSVFVFPIGVGVFLNSDLATKIILGSQWGDASGVVGLWALTSAITIVFGNFCSEVYRAKGKPKLSFIAQVLHLIVLVPTCMISAKYGFWVLVLARSVIRLQIIFVHSIIMKKVIGISLLNSFRNVIPTGTAVLIMGCSGYFINQMSEGIVWSFVSIALCVLIYFGILFLFPKMRQELLALIKKIIPKKLNKKYAIAKTGN